MSSDIPQPASNQPEDQIQPVNATRRELPPRPTPKTIDAASQSRNSYERLRIVRILAIGLVVALGLDAIASILVCFFAPADPSRLYNGSTKDILLVISSFGAYLLGKGSSERKDDK